MLSDGQLITAITGVFMLNSEAKKMGLKLVSNPHEYSGDGMNTEFEVHLKGADTGFFVQIGMGEASLDFFDGDASREIARLGKDGFATPVTEFVEKIIETIKAMEVAS